MAEMIIGYISEKELPIYRSLLLPEMVRAIEKKEAVTALGISVEEVACGAVAGYIEEEIFKIKSLFISPDYRRYGHATGLIRELRFLLKMYTDVKDMELSFTISHKEHELFIPFLEKTGFIQEDNFGRTLYMLPMEKLVTSSLAKEMTKNTSLEFLPFAEISEYQLYELSRRLEQQDVPLPAKDLTDPSILPDISFVHKNNNTIDAFVSFHYSLGGRLTLSGVWVNSPSPVILPLLLQKALRKIREDYRQEEVILIQTVNDSSTRLLKKLFPDCIPVSYTYHYRFPYITDWRY